MPYLIWTNDNEPTDAVAATALYRERKSYDERIRASKNVCHVTKSRANEMKR